MPNPDLAAALNDLGARIKRQQVSPTTRDPYLVASFERVQVAVIATCDELLELTKRIVEMEPRYEPKPNGEATGDQRADASAR